MFKVGEAKLWCCTNAFSNYDIFNLQGFKKKHNPTVSGGRSVYITIANSAYFPH